MSYPYQTVGICLLIVVSFFVLMKRIYEFGYKHGFDAASQLKKDFDHLFDNLENVEEGEDWKDGWEEGHSQGYNDGLKDIEEK